MTSLTETKKRCPNGSRRNKKTNMCIKFPNIKTFENISDLKISQTNNTLSVESLGEDGSILKFYEKQILQSQILIKEEDIQKAKKSAHKDIRKLLHLFSFKTPILEGKKIRKNVKSIVGISPTMVLLFPLH